jgi:subtilisin family serine protease
VRRALAALGAVVLAALLLPAATMASPSASSRYVVILDGDYALDGSYALGAGYALVRQYALEAAYALDDGYALGAGYALGSGYALAEEYALRGHYALDDAYALSSDYALYALDGSYALASDYALYALYALDDVYALTGAKEGSDGYALAQDYALTGIYALDDNYALARDYALTLIAQAGGTVTSDLSRQIGVMVVDSKNAAFAETVSSYALVAGVVRDFGWKQFPTLDEAIASGQLTIVQQGPVLPTATDDPLESLQWDMDQIRAPQAHAKSTGSPNVKVGVLDSGIDGNHLDFMSNGRSNVDCAIGADFTTDGPGIGIPAACVDNHFHGTHVAGIIAARANGHGIVGVAPDITLVPIKVCGDPEGYCYFSNVVEGITYSGDLALDIINMSFFVDDDAFHESTEFKCASDATQLLFRETVQRSLKYARKQGVTPIAALGNSDVDLANPPGGKSCKVVPAMSDGVVGVAALGPESEKASYSNWGKGWTDVSAPGGNGNVQGDTAAYCTRQIISTIPGNLWACLQGTSMAAPHAAGVAALISSRIGVVTRTGGWYADPDKVAAQLQKTTIDIGIKGDDKCFGVGRIDALRAVSGTFTYTYSNAAPSCPEYSE